MEIVAADIGGTHARFAIAQVDGGRVTALGEPVTLPTSAYASIEAAWIAFGQQIERPLPRAAGIAVASPIAGDVIRLTNNRWTIQASRLRGLLGIDIHTLVNDFGAVAHAVAQAPDDAFVRLCGDTMPPATGVTTICGPGTGLGVAQLLRTGAGYQVVETEGGHIDFAPLDAFEDAMLRRLRGSLRRVSAERIVAGPGIVAIHDTLAAIEGRAIAPRDATAIWTAALEGRDILAVSSLDRFCRCLGAVAGDLALAQGAGRVVIAGGLGLRLKDRLVASGFADRFVAKGRFEARMAAIPVDLIVLPQPGLYGAAAAFAQEHM